MIDFLIEVASNWCLSRIMPGAKPLGRAEKTVAFRLGDLLCDVAIDGLAPQHKRQEAFRLGCSLMRFSGEPEVLNRSKELRANELVAAQPGWLASVYVTLLQFDSTACQAAMDLVGYEEKAGEQDRFDGLSGVFYGRPDFRVTGECAARAAEQIIGADVAGRASLLDRHLLKAAREFLDGRSSNSGS